ncbi:MAG TPA: DUF3500 domain-containing protein, partial [Polyangiaceae bacterium]
MDRSARRRGLFLALFSLAGLAATACSGGDTVGATADEDGGTDESDGGTSASGDGGVNVDVDVDAAVAQCADAGESYAKVVCAADVFLSTLSDTEKSTVQYDWTDGKAKTVWSNLPGVTRNGMKFGAMSDTQRAAALAIARSVMSDQGYAHMIGVFAGDDYLNSLQSSGGGGGPGGGYSSDNYSIAFIGVPSTTND